MQPHEAKQYCQLKLSTVVPQPSEGPTIGRLDVQLDNMHGQLSSMAEHHPYGLMLIIPGQLFAFVTSRFG